MKIKISIIDKDLRTMGRIIKVVNNTFTESRLRLMYKISRKNRFKIEDDRIQFTEEWIPRQDGSRMRICMFRPLSPKANVTKSKDSSEYCISNAIIPNVR
jgi:hypothetical protein